MKLESLAGHMLIIVSHNGIPISIIKPITWATTELNRLAQRIFISLKNDQAIECEKFASKLYEAATRSDYIINEME